MGLINNGIITWMTKNAKEIYLSLISAEQTRVQKTKNDVRMLDSYDFYIFVNEFAENTPVAFFTNILKQKIQNLNDLLSAMRTVKRKKIHWADMGGGMALAMRQHSSQSNQYNSFSYTNIDIRDVKTSELTRNEADYLAQNFPNILDDDYRNSERNPMDQLIDIIKSNNINHFIKKRYRQDPQNSFNILIIQKKPDTHLVFNGNISSLIKNYYGYKIVTYGDYQNLFEITSTPPNHFSEDYYERMNKIFLGMK